jgi:hypothetical protein
MRIIYSFPLLVTRARPAGITKRINQNIKKRPPRLQGADDLHSKGILMDSSTSDLIVRLRSLIAQLGNNGGLISPSVYETAQVLRLHPPSEGVEPGLQWLLEQQHADGGWGVPTVPSARDIPTLAALLTLYTYRLDVAADNAIQRGLDFLKRQAKQWMWVHIDLMPVAGEMILPYLLEEAERAGLLIDQSPYARIFELRRVKLQYLERKSILPNSAPSFSWEALGFPHVSQLLDAETGVGHSPAATAAWLRTAQEVGEDRTLCTQAKDYLARASATTGTGIPGVMPMAYPITGFELCYGLYGLLLTGWLNHPALQDVVAPKLAELRKMVELGQGLGFGKNFVPDVDDTAVAVAVLQAAGQAPDTRYVHRFWHGDHFYTYAHELNPSVYSNAHALHALVLCGERCKSTEEFLIQQQTERGGWDVDKWHTSWRSSTMEVVAALSSLGYEEQLYRAGQALVDDQNPDGSWGSSNGAPMLETTYSLIALQLLILNSRIVEQIQPALELGQQWLLSRLDRLDDIERVWLCKEVFSLIRVDGIYKLSVLLSSMLQARHPLVNRLAGTTTLPVYVYEKNQ